MAFVRFSAGALGSFVIVFATALVVGAWTRRRILGRSSLPCVPLDAALGFGVVGTGLLALGLLHLLRFEVVLALAAVIHVAAAAWWRRAVRQGWTVVRSAPPATRLIAIGFAVGLAPLLVLTLYPPSGYDATAYHLPYARAFAQEGAVPFLPDVQPPIFPQLQELLFTAGFLVGPDVVAHLLQLASAVLVGLLMLAWRPLSWPARLWAAALWFGTPHVVWMSGAAYVDLGMTLAIIAAVYAWHRAREEPALSTRWWAIAGGCAGFAAATKYLGLFFVAAGVAAAVVTVARGRRAGPLLAFGAAAAAAAGPWYLRLYLETGNPLFPYFASWFHAADLAWSPEARPLLRWADLGVGQVPFARRAADGLTFLALVPWNALVHRELFAWQAPLSPYYPVILPLLLPVAMARRASRPLAALAVAYALTCLVLTPRDLRYLLPAWPLVNLAVMDAAVALISRRRPRLVCRPAVVLGLAAVLAAPGVAYATYRLIRQGPPPVTAETRQAYLARWVPGHEAIAWLNRLHGPEYGVYAIYGLRLAYHAEGRVLGGWIGPARYDRIVPLLADPAALHAALGELGVDHLLMVSDVDLPAPPAPDTPAWRARFVRVLAGGPFVLYRRAGP